MNTQNCTQISQRSTLISSTSKNLNRIQLYLVKFGQLVIYVHLPDPGT